MGRRLAGAVLSLAGLWLAACATPETAALIEAPGSLPPRAEVSGVPFFPQEEHHCGPAALATVLNWSELERAPEEIARRVYTPGREGSLRSDMLAAVRRDGRLAVPLAGLRDVLAEVAAGHPVLVFQNLGLDWYPQWHYAVAVGYDLERREIALRSGRERRRLLSFETFERTWQRGGNWAYLVLKPDRLPASADADAVVRAARALEGAGREPEALAAYGAVLTRWPDSYGALMGLGNLWHGLGDFAGAEQAYRRAIAAVPERAEAWNNLAYVLSARGHRGEAVEAAREALRRAPADREPYLDTLREIAGVQG